MFNVLLDPLPREWHGYPVDMDFQTGIQISQCLTDADLSNEERAATAVALIFPEQYPTDAQELQKALEWYLNGWNHDQVSSKKKESKSTELMDFDIDQWRIYAAFRQQYGINLNRQRLHFWEFMGLLSNLEECAFTRVISIRDKKVTSKMSKEEKDAYVKAKKMYAICKEEVETEEEKADREAAIEEFNRLRGSS